MINVIMRGPIRPSLDFTLAAIDNVNKSMCGQNWRLTVTTWEAPEGEQLKKRFPDQVLLSCIPIQEESINACPSNKPEHLWWYQHPWALSYLRRLVSTQNVLKIIPPGEWIIETRTDNNIIFNPIDSPLKQITFHGHGPNAAWRSFTDSHIPARHRHRARPIQCCRTDP